MMAENNSVSWPHSNFAQWPPEKTVEALAESVTGRLSGRWHSSIRASIRHINWRPLFGLSHAGGLQVSEIVVQQDLLSTDRSLRDQRAKLIADCIVAAADSGVTTINVFSGPAAWEPGALRIPEEMSEGAAWELATRELRALGRVGGEA